MLRFDHYFSDLGDGSYHHPLFRSLDEMAKHREFHEAKVEIVHPRVLIRNLPTKLYLRSFTKSGDELGCTEAEEWDDELNDALIQRHIRAISVENEKVRFALGLRASFENAETRFGDGFYNSALVHYIKFSPLGDEPAVTELLRHIARSSIDPSSRSYLECRDMMDAAISGRAKELMKELGYGRPEAEDILASAVVQYLDERFSVAHRRVLGFV